MTPDVQAHKSDAQHALDGVRICLVFEHSLSHYTRLLQEMKALIDAGADLQILTSFESDETSPLGLERTIVPLESETAIAASTLSWRYLRIADNVLRGAIRRVLGLMNPGATKARRSALERIAKQVDIFWVVDYPSLPSTLAAAQRHGARVVYETVDLVPEYPYRGERFRQRALAGERARLGQVDGFITACDSYADYYMENNADVLSRRPVVRDNSPGHMVSAPRPTGRPLRILFLGSLMFDRPVLELIEAMAEVRADATLTFQGKNYLGDEPSRRIDELGLGDRVFIADPCPPQSIVDTAARYDVGVVALRGDNENERRASTSKIFTYMAAGLAILGSDLPGIARIVQSHHNGILVGGMRPRDWATAIEKIAALSAADVDAMKARSLAAARTYSWDKQGPEFVAEFVRVAQSGPS